MPNCDVVRELRLTCTPACVRHCTVKVVAYGQFLLATGAYGYYMSGYNDKAKHGAFMGMGGDAVVRCAFIRS